MIRRYFLAITMLFVLVSAEAQSSVHQFSLGKKDFLLDGRPLQLISGEMHPARIPRQYWRQRIQMARAMGCNTIAVYIFWNYHESTPGVFDFTTGNKDIAAFIRLCKEEGMWVLLRPGPYVCAEWDWGGLPFYLLKIPDIKIRCMDPRYMAAVKRYVERFAKEVTALQCTNGGPILMVQVENEYGSYANDRTYLETLRKLWITNGIKVPFYTADGPTAFMLEAGNLNGCAIGLDSGGSDADFAQAEKHQPGVPAFSSESYPGWLTHWKEPWQRPDSADILRELDYLLSHKRSFNLYVVHGGTNFGYNAGANAFTPVQFQPDVTSYDYDAPIDEQGRPTPKFFAIQRLITKYTGHVPPPLPAAIPIKEIPAFDMQPFASLWQVLPAAIRSPQPLPMEMLDQSEGFILYRTRLIGHKSGSLTITEPHDYAMVFLNGVLIDTVFRDGGKWTIKLPETNTREPVLEILVESMGHINFAQYMIDRKGITDRVTLNGMTLMNWEIVKLPMTESFIAQLKPGLAPGMESGRDGVPSAGISSGATAGPGTSPSPSLAAAHTARLADSLAGSLAKRPGIFFRGTFTLDQPQPADTYLDLSHYHQGVVWVNGHNLGRYWNVGPQFRLYCPAPWLKKGKNEVIVFDLHQLEGAPIRGVKTLDGPAEGE